MPKHMLHEGQPPIVGAKPYNDMLIEWLRADHEEACAYLRSSFEDGNMYIFLMALRNVAQAYGGVGP